ncbi:MAG: beta-N-acetylhexosaminidase [Candidatus Methylomirabilales bacterium]
MTRAEILRLFCFGFDGHRVPDHTREQVRAGLRAVILFARNLRDPEQVCRLNGDLAGAGARLIGVDQEGGRVVRLPPPFSLPPPAAAVGAWDDPPRARRLAAAIGAELRAAGFTWNTVPVLDIHTNPANPVIGDRAYGADPALVARTAIAVMRGFADAGILTTGKHFPGHGDSGTDSHHTLPICSQAAARWDAVELLPFREAIRAGIPALMVAHLQCPALDAAAPTSLSHTVITDLLRRRLGFAGLVVSDDLEMAAIAGRGDVGEAAVRFLEAGGDLILICRRRDYQEQAVEAVEAAVRTGRLPAGRLKASLDRLAAIEHSLPAPAANPERLGGLLADARHAAAARGSEGWDS